MLREILTAAFEEQNVVQLVGQCATHAELPGLIDRVQPDVVVAGCDESEVEVLGRQLVESHPWLTLLAVTGDGRCCILFRLTPSVTRLGELSPAGLIDAVRASQQEATHG